MKELKDYSEELNKCSKCGLCESVCPLFRLSPNDCIASKGKFIMLYGVTQGKLKISKNINKYLDMCLKCGKCKEACPAGVDLCEILFAAKQEYVKTAFSSKIIRFFQSELVMETFLNFGSIISKFFRPKRQSNIDSLNVLYFKGCVNKICPRTDNYLSKIFKNKQVNIIEPDFKCCGLPFLSEGNLEEFEKSAKHNIKLFKEQSFDYFVSDCASCENTLNSYATYFSEAQNLLQNINWGEIIVKEDLKFKYKKPLKVTFHKPCHLANDSFFEKIISNCSNVDYIKMQDYDNCCGLAGSFALKNPNLSKKLREQKIKNIEQTEADYVITTCPACLLSLKQGLLKSRIKAVSLLEFLAKGDSVSE